MVTLQDILEHKRREVEVRKRAIPMRELAISLDDVRPVRYFANALSGDSIKVIAEVKRASPSRGAIRPGADPAAIARVYQDNGAAAISVLADAKYFDGDPGHIAAVKRAVIVPVLCKEFIVDPYQIFEARLWGADAVLLIAAALDREVLRDYISLAREQKLDPLVEIHRAEELEKALAAGARTIGINNRNLATFQTDASVTKRLRRLVPDDCLVVSESGVSRREEVADLESMGIHAVLIGESLMASPDPGEKLRELLGWI